MVVFFSLSWDAFYAEAFARMRNSNLSEESLALLKNVGIVIVIATIVFSILLKAFLYYKIGKGMNWARIVLLVFAVLGIPYQLYSAVKVGLRYSAVENSDFGSHLAHAMHGWPPLPLVGIGLLSAIGTVIALVLLFTGKANAWFHTKK